MSVNAGKKFEQDWKASFAKTPYFYMRLRDSAKWVKGQGSTFTPSNIADAIVYAMPFLFILELKSTKGASISFYPNTPWQKPKDAKGQVMIKPNQVKDLMNAAAYKGVIPGFVINFRERELKSKAIPAVTYFVQICDFISFVKDAGKSSLSKDDCEKIGIWIPHEKKKVHYRYDILHFVDAAALTYLKRGYIKTENLKELRQWINLLISEKGVNVDEKSVI